MQLIIAEKKLAAYAYAKALSNNYTEKEGYLIGENRIIYTWAQGHLLQLADPGDIREEWEAWVWEQLPILPTEIPLKPIKNQEKQLYLIKTLANQCSSLVNGMDCAGEGELIFYEIVRYLKLEHLPTKRLWTASLQSTAIREAYQNLRSQGEFTHLRTAAFTRNRLDYLTGINTSRSLTLVGDGQTLAMGRLIGSSLSLIDLRARARAEFEEENYYAIKGQFKQDQTLFTANYSGGKITSKEVLGETLNLITQNAAALDYTDQIKEQLPPFLLNHTDVLVIIFQRYGLKPKETSRVLEQLYIKGLITYPRTDSRFVTKDEIVPMRATFRIMSEVFPNLSKGSNIDKFNVQNERVVNTVSDHHALIPTLEIPKNLKEEEKWVYQLILERFFLQVQQPKKTNVRSVTVQYTDEIKFKTTFQITMEPGWKGLA
ncbi:DNA topoisomerase [Solibacillus sp. FSL K6-1554]|uniref:DNA topoisomerase n=1 Tax=Solibacillus sp. FSL K6-1554 TaxID=2921472 RepID=UPI0030F8BE60